MKQRSVQYNFIMNFILTSSSILFPLITFPYVSRILLPIGTGKVAFATSTISYFTMIAMLGIPTYGIRAVAQVRNNAAKLKTLVCELLIINLVMGAIAYGLLFLGILLVPQLAASKTLMLICSLAIVLNVIGVNWFYQGMEQYTYITWVSIAFKVIGVVTMFLFIHSQQDYLWYGFMTVISSFGSGLVNFFMLFKALKSGTLEKMNFKRHFKPISTFFAMTVATTIYTNLDTVMLGFMKGDYEVGLYNASIKIKTLLVSLVTSLGTVLLPRLSYYIEQKQEADFQRLVGKAFSFVLLFAIPVCLFCSVYASQILLIISGADYLPAQSAMILLMPTIVLIGLSNVSGIQILVPLGCEKQVLYSVSAGAILDLVLNSICIPYFGAAGAAFGTLAAETLVLVWQLVCLKSRLQSLVAQIEWKPLWGSLLICIPSLAAAFFVQSMNPFVAIVLGAALFFGLDGIGLLVFKEQIVMGFVKKITHSR